MEPKRRDYIAVVEQMEKRADGLWDIAPGGGGVEALLTALALPIGAGLGAAHIASDMSSPGPGPYPKIRDTEMLTVLNRLTEQARQRARQLRGEAD